MLFCELLMDVGVRGEAMVLLLALVTYVILLLLTLFLFAFVELLVVLFAVRLSSKGEENEVPCRVGDDDDAGEDDTEEDEGTMLFETNS